MADDTILTLAEIGELFYDLTVDLLGASSNPEVRLSWPTGGAPAFGVVDDVTFLRILDTEGGYTRQRENIYTQEGSPEEPNMAISYTRQLEVGYIIYGPNSWSNAVNIRNKIFYQEHHDTLAKKNIYLVPNFNPPRRMPELWQGQWYERADLAMRFYELVVVNEPIPSLKSVEIGLYDRKGLVTTLDIDE